ncbi:hypothetical protein GCM10027589_41680 [Actinocorallia lasiicapitis]
MKVGDLVEVLSAEEILATLDENGELENLPFMPEMLRFCGTTLRVHRTAHKVCDVIEHSGLRRMEGAVHLVGARCDGSAHGGCETACSLYWKEAWLRPATREKPPEEVRPALPIVAINGTILDNTRKEPAADGTPRYSCQATEILRAAPGRWPLHAGRQYLLDVQGGNASLALTLRGLFFGLFNRYQNLSRKILPRLLWIRGGLRWGWVEGRAGRTTPTGTLDLQPGELVRVRPREEILATLNGELKNRGLGFEEEMARYCGRTARVASRVERCLDERTGELLLMKNPNIILEGLVCQGAYSANCPREYVMFWREIWLERVAE